MGRAWLSERSFTVNRTVVDSIDGLKKPVDGAETEIVQLGTGQITGRLTRAPMCRQISVARHLLIPEVRSKDDGEADEKSESET
jgi:hypothetical protein